MSDIDLSDIERQIDHISAVVNTNEMENKMINDRVNYLETRLNDIERLVTGNASLGHAQSLLDGSNLKGYGLAENINELDLKIFFLEKRMMDNQVDEMLDL